MQGRYQTADQALVREMNLSIILRYLHAGGPMSRASLASLAGLNKTTVSSLADELLRRGLLHQVGLDNTRTGRPATLLELNPDAGLIAGVALGVDFISVILADFVGQIRWRR
ncbi:MAG: ArsR family transcriptional regulator, partial [Chloroflexi bacterium]